MENNHACHVCFAKNAQKIVQSVRQKLYFLITADPSFRGQFEKHVSINHDTGEITVVKAFDREMTSEMTFLLHCNLNNHTKQQEMRMRIKDVNDNGPYITNGHIGRHLKEEHITISTEAYIEKVYHNP